MTRRGRFSPKDLLDLVEQIDGLASRFRAAEDRPAERRRLATRKAAALRRLRSALGRGGDAFRAALRGLAGATGLSARDLVFVVLLFNRRLRRPKPTTRGRELLEAATTRGDLAGRAKALHPDAPLLRAGFVVSDAYAPEHVFDAEFRLNDDVFRLLYRAYHRLVFDPSSPDPIRPTPFTSAADHLLALRTSVDLAKRRAARLFPQSGWAEAYPDEDRAPEELQRLFELRQATLRAREAVTPDSVRLPMIALRREFGLDADEELVLAALLVQELYSARGSIELGELLRLIARDASDLLDRRFLVGPTGRLRAAGLVETEEETEGKDLAASAWLPPWATERLLGADAPPRAIDEADRTRFREYLETLQGSDDFYRRLS
jgi:hypothetical protein